MENFLRFAFLSFMVLTVGFLNAQKLDLDKLKDIKIRSIGPAGMSGRITAIDAVVSNPDIIYAGAASGGVWKSTSGGVSWEPVFDEQNVLSIGAIAIQQDNPSVVWAGTGEGNPRNSLNGGFGIYKSLDAGKTWKLMGLENTRNIHRIIVDPKNPNTVYVGAIGSPWGEHPERGVYKTTDGGATWKHILKVDNKTGCADLVMDPANPNKLFAAMWEHRRWPWFFKSGGPGSGLYVTYDGGDNWKKLSSDDGLPEGELGRIGLAIARSKPDIVYALIESKKNALYRSEDGGVKWSKVNDKNEIGNRPFYYAEIHVDSKNENRLYTVYSSVSVSEDGGKSFQQLLGYFAGVHPDHHAFWINPEDPSMIIDGNDGGLNITRDMGKTWQFAENIPVGQFYHVNVDMEHPYNVYGGMQDNGSWAGPSYVWRNAGIRNSYWQEVLFGDGFDVSPDPEDARFGYAMSQQGNLARYDLETGAQVNLQPTHPDPKMKLRFNWNAALAQDPFSKSTIYYGSQFVHKSTDKGSTWEIISPDLTTNDPSKQKQGDSGGLTMDATGAENHTTILAIAPSAVKEGVIWVGTDDGNVQLTQDAGKTWTNVAPKIVGMPKYSWVAQIQASKYNDGEAFVVVNNYRQFDFKPYLFRTRNYGATWESMVSAAQVGANSYTLAVVQDPVEPKLLFLGTDNGLFVTIDEGKNWTRWTNDFPAGVCVMDMVIHPREHDLVIATFGRALYIMDDIRPLRAMAKSGAGILNKTVTIFSPPDAYNVESQQPSGIRFNADAVYEGQNRPRGGLISYAINKPSGQSETVKQEANTSKRGRRSEPAAPAQPAAKKSDRVKYDSVKLEFFSSTGTLIRTMRMKAPKENGLHRTIWNLAEEGVPRPTREERRGGGGFFGFGPSGVDALPGSYKVRITYGDQSDSTTINLKSDPRYSTTIDVIQARYNMQKDLEKLTSVVGQAASRLRESLKVVEGFEKELKESKRDDLKEAADKTKAMNDSINAILDYIFGPDDKRQGITRDPDPTPLTFIYNARSYIGSSREPINDTDRRVFKHADDKVAEMVNKVNAFFADQWAPYRATMEMVTLSPFKDYEPLKKN